MFLADSDEHQTLEEEDTIGSRGLCRWYFRMTGQSVIRPYARPLREPVVVQANPWKGSCWWWLRRKILAELLGQV